MTVKQKKIISKTFKILAFILFLLAFLSISIMLLYLKMDKDWNNLIHPTTNDDIYSIIVSIISSLSVSSLLWITIGKLAKLFKKKKN